MIKYILLLFVVTCALNIFCVYKTIQAQNEGFAQIEKMRNNFYKMQEQQLWGNTNE